MDIENQRTSKDHETHRTRRQLLTVLLGLPPISALARLLKPSNDAVLRVEIRDEQNGEIIEAMVCVTSLSDGKWRTPPDGRSVKPYTIVRNFYEGLPAWEPGDIGPVRLTNGDYHDNNMRSYVYEEKSSYPFWREPAAYFVSRPFSIVLPPGKWRLAVYRGLEYIPVSIEFEIAVNEQKRQSIRLRRWADMAKTGWYSGDDHVHLVRLNSRQNELLMTWALAEDVHVCNILRQGQLNEITFEQIGFGRNARYQKNNYVLVSGQEDPSTEIHEQGHAIALNINKPYRNVDRYHLYNLMFDAVHAQGGLAGYAHLAWAREFFRRTRHESFATWDATINVARGKVDFLEILQFRSLGLEDYYDFLNLGFRLTASAGSDVPWGNTIGEVRMYVFTGERFCADSWFAAMKKGRTFVTNGPMIQLNVEDAILGDELKYDRPVKLRIRAKAWAPENIGSPKTLEIVAQGDVIHSATSHAPNQSELQLDFVLKTEASLWITARATSFNGAFAHTSPIYVIVAGKSFCAQQKLPQLVKERLRVLRFIHERLRDPAYIASYKQGEVEALIQEIQQAEAAYNSLLVGH